MTEPLAHMVGTVLTKEESDYIESILKACSEELTIKTYSVVRETSFDVLKKQVDAIIEANPMMELAAAPLNMTFLNIDKWVAILVEYEES